MEEGKYLVRGDFMFIGEVVPNQKVTIVLKNFEGNESVYQAMTVKTLFKNKNKRKIVIDDLEFAGKLSQTVSISVIAELGHGVYTWHGVEIVKLNSEIAKAKLDSGECIKVDVTSAIIKTSYKAEYADRRIAPRINLQLPCTINMLNGKCVKSNCMTLIKDISSSGVGLVTQCAICDVGDTVGISFRDDILKLKVDCVVKIVRNRELKSGEIEYGAIIEESSPNAEDYVRLKSQEMCLGLYVKRK